MKELILSTLEDHHCDLNYIKLIPKSYISDLDFVEECVLLNYNASYLLEFIDKDTSVDWIIDLIKKIKISDIYKDLSEIDFEPQEKQDIEYSLKFDNNFEYKYRLLNILPENIIVNFKFIKLLFINLGEKYIEHLNFCHQNRINYYISTHQIDQFLDTSKYAFPYNMENMEIYPNAKKYLRNIRYLYNIMEGILDSGNINNYYSFIKFLPLKIKNKIIKKYKLFCRIIELLRLSNIPICIKRIIKDYIGLSDYELKFWLHSTSKIGNKVLVP